MSIIPQQTKEKNSQSAVKDFNGYLSPQLMTENKKSKNTNPNPMAESLHIPDVRDFKKPRKPKIQATHTENKLRKGSSGHNVNKFDCKD